MNPFMQCPRCLVEKKTRRGLLRHMGSPCHLDTPGGRRAMNLARRTDPTARRRKYTKWRVP